MSSASSIDSVWRGSTKNQFTTSADPSAATVATNRPPITATTITSTRNSNRSVDSPSSSSSTSNAVVSAGTPPRNTRSANHAAAGRGAPAAA